MPTEELSPQERGQRGKRLLLYGMFAIVLIPTVALFLLLWLWLAPVGFTNVAIRTTLIVAAVAIITCVIIWFVYTKVILKE